MTRDEAIERSFMAALRMLSVCPPNDEHPRTMLVAARKIFNEHIRERGYVVVPVEPTKEMVLAGDDKLDDCTDSGYSSNAYGERSEYTYMQSDTPAQIYRAMLEAAR